MPASKTPAKTAPAKKPAASKSAANPAAKAAAPKAAAKPRAAAKPAAQRAPALAFLMEQHREAERLFAAYEKAGDDERKTELSAQICKALKVHTQIEEELLYPAAHEQLKDEDMVDEAYVEHDSAKALIAQIEAGRVGDHMYDAKVKVLSEYVKHHVQEEENELFPAIEKTPGIDLAAMDERLRARAEELMVGTEREGPSPGASLLQGLKQIFQPGT